MKSIGKSMEIFMIGQQIHEKKCTILNDMDFPWNFHGNRDKGGAFLCKLLVCFTNLISIDKLEEQSTTKFPFATHAQ